MLISPGLPASLTFAPAFAFAAVRLDYSTGPAADDVSRLASRDDDERPVVSHVQSRLALDGAETDRPQLLPRLALGPSHGLKVAVDDFRVADKVVGGDELPLVRLVLLVAFDLLFPLDLASLAFLVFGAGDPHQRGPHQRHGRQDRRGGQDPPRRAGDPRLVRLSFVDHHLDSPFQAAAHRGQPHGVSVLNLLCKPDQCSCQIHRPGAAVQRTVVGRQLALYLPPAAEPPYRRTPPRRGRNAPCHHAPQRVAPGEVPQFMCQRPPQGRPDGLAGPLGQDDCGIDDPRRRRLGQPGGNVDGKLRPQSHSPRHSPGNRRPGRRGRRPLPPPPRQADHAPHQYQNENATDQQRCPDRQCAPGNRRRRPVIPRGRPARRCDGLPAFRSDCPCAIVRVLVPTDHAMRRVCGLAPRATRLGRKAFGAALAPGILAGDRRRGRSANVGPAGRPVEQARRRAQIVHRPRAGQHHRDAQQAQATDAATNDGAASQQDQRHRGQGHHRRPECRGPRRIDRQFHAHSATPSPLRTRSLMAFRSALLTRGAPRRWQSSSSGRPPNRSPTSLSTLASA